MAFYGSYFSFDGVSCRDYNLMVYDFGSSGQDDTVAFGSTGTAVEDRTANRYSSFFYGIKQDRPLTFNLTFGADCCLLEKERPFQRLEVARISSWLTGHNEWKWLTIEQPDMLFVRYRCYISALQLITYDGKPWAFSCTVNCDSPYGYLEEETTTYEITGSTEIEIVNPGSYHGYYYPRMIIDVSSEAQLGAIRLRNTTDTTQSFYIVGIPAGDRVLVDGENQVMTALKLNTNNEYEADESFKPYNSFSKKFLGLVQGPNQIVIDRVYGPITLQIITEFPVDIGA